MRGSSRTASNRFVDDGARISSRDDPISIANRTNDRVDAEMRKTRPKFDRSIGSYVAADDVATTRSRFARNRHHHHWYDDVSSLMRYSPKRPISVVTRYGPFYHRPCPPCWTTGRGLTLTICSLSPLDARNKKKQ